MKKRVGQAGPGLVGAGLFCALVIAGAGSPASSAVAQEPPGARAGAAGAPPQYTAADVHFMSGMILHHAQAVLMASWARSHDASPSVRELCDRIGVSQRDEIAFMQRWLRERRQPVPDADTAAQRTMPGMPGMSMPAMGQTMLMPGMLTGAQLAALDSARGPTFDRLFLQFMIQHHQGALTMVQDLINTPGAAQDGQVFQFASDVNADQTAEIGRMRRMLAGLLFGAPSQ